MCHFSLTELNDEAASPKTFSSRKDPKKARSDVDPHKSSSSATSEEEAVGHAANMSVDMISTPSDFLCKCNLNIFYLSD